MSRIAVFLSCTHKQEHMESCNNAEQAWSTKWWWWVPDCSTGGMYKMRFGKRQKQMNVLPKLATYKGDSCVAVCPNTDVHKKAVRQEVFVPLQFFCLS